MNLDYTAQIYTGGNAIGASRWLDIRQDDSVLGDLSTFNMFGFVYLEEK